MSRPSSRDSSVSPASICTPASTRSKITRATPRAHAQRSFRQTAIRNTPQQGRVHEIGKPGDGQQRIGRVQAAPQDLDARIESLDRDDHGEEADDDAWVGGRLGRGLGHDAPSGGRGWSGRAGSRTSRLTNARSDAIVDESPVRSDGPGRAPPQSGRSRISARTTRPLRPPSRAVQSGCSNRTLPRLITPTARQKERTTHHDDQDCDHDLRGSCEHHATPAASRHDRFGGPALVLPDQRLHELPRARSDDRRRALPDLRVRPPNALSPGHRQARSSRRTTSSSTSGRRC